MNAINVNNFLTNCNIADEFRHAIVMVAHLVIMMTHGPSDVTPLEAEMRGRREHAATMTLARSL